MERRHDAPDAADFRGQIDSREPAMIAATKAQAAGAAPSEKVVLGLIGAGGRAHI